MEGRVSSVQSMGAVDGPGLRYVVFLQGCPLRCAYCHNPETWDLTGGTPYTAEDFCKTILRYRPYFGENGGVTVSGGEPLLQPEFVAELFQRLHDSHNNRFLPVYFCCNRSRKHLCRSSSSLLLAFPALYLVHFD